MSTGDAGFVLLHNGVILNSEYGEMPEEPEDGFYHMFENPFQAIFDNNSDCKFKGNNSNSIQLK